MVLNTFEGHLAAGLLMTEGVQTNAGQTDTFRVDIRAEILAITWAVETSRHAPFKIIMLKQRNSTSDSYSVQSSVSRRYRYKSASIDILHYPL
jgi:hypothetical protein